MNKRDALKLLPGDRLIVGDVRHGRGWYGAATVIRATIKGGIRARVDDDDGGGERWFGYHQAQIDRLMPRSRDTGSDFSE